MIRKGVLSTVLLCAAGIFAAPLTADVQFTIEEPSKNGSKSGIGLISGWAVSDRKIVMVEVFIDGASLGEVPYGGSRQDVAAVFPDLPDSEFSGWAIKWNHGLLEDGEHTLTVVVTEDNGNQVSKEMVFSAIGFNSQFVSDPADVHTSGALISSPQDGRIVIQGAEVEGEMVDIELAWDTASQQFLIDTLDYGLEPEENQAPTADVGADLTVDQGANVVVAGSASDPDGFIAGWTWQQVSGPAVSLSNANSAEVQFTAPATDSVIGLRLTVIDDDGASDSDELQITVEAPVADPNQPPSADAGPDRTVDTGAGVAISGSASDPDGFIAGWTWQQVSGPAVALFNANSSQVQFTAPGTAGVIGLRLVVIDDDEASDSDEVLITVVEPAPDPNQPPSADAGPDRTVDTGASVVISGSASDPDGFIAGWTWQQVSGPAVTLFNANSSQVQFTAPGIAGIIRLRLTVTDDDGAGDSDDVLITVNESAPPPNQPPSADAGSDQSVAQGATVTVNGSASDPDGSITSWAWQQISGTSVSLSNANSSQVQFTAPGTAGDIQLRLTVTDDDGASDSDDVTITVQSGGGGDGTTGSTLSSMLPLINAARGTSRSCGGTQFPAQPPLAWSSALANVARSHSMDMARQGYFSHTSLDGTSMGTRVFAVWSGNRVGENIAASTANRSDSFIVNGWLASAGHCALIMDPNFTHAGVGTGHRADNGFTFQYFWTLDFGG